MSFYLVKIIQLLVMPPALMIFIMLAGLILMRWSKRYGKILIISGLLLLVAASLPIITRPLVLAMENIPPLNIAQMKNSDAGAIIILSGSSYLNAPEYESDTVATSTLERIRYGAYVHRQTKLPVLVTGGRVFEHINIAESVLMKKVLNSDFQTPVMWLEDQARNTWENAQYSYRILKQEKIKKIILVTHAMHMRRSLMSFEAAGFEVIPAPLAYHSGKSNIAVSKFLPSAKAMYNLRQVMHEVFGILWYRLRYT